MHSERSGNKELKDESKKHLRKKNFWRKKMLKQDESHHEWTFKCFMVAGLVAWEIKCADDKTAHLITLYDGLRSSHSFGSMIWSFLLGCHYELGVGVNAVYKPRWKKPAKQQVYAVFFPAGRWNMELPDMTRVRHRAHWRPESLSDC